jgi:hypothetical protein
MFRRYDIQDARDIQRAGEIMERWRESQGSISTISSTITEKGQSALETKKDSKRLN